MLSISTLRLVIIDLSGGIELSTLLRSCHLFSLRAAAGRGGTEQYEKLRGLRRSRRLRCIFPSQLRDAIPDHKPSMGQCLQLDSVDAQAAHTVEWGRRIQIKLRVCETGKLTGEFDIWVDIELTRRVVWQN